MGNGKALRFAVLFSLVSVTGIARAQTRPSKIECITADTDGQSLRMNGRLLRARSRFAVCAARACPTIVRDDCLQRIVELETAQPTLLFTATNGDGRRLTTVRVIVDGALFAEHLDGRPLAVDPGEHRFVFEALGRVSDEMTLTLSEGVKNEGHGVVLRTDSGEHTDPPLAAPDENAAAAAMSTPTLPQRSPSRAATRRKPQAKPDSLDTEGRTAAVVVGAFGVLGVSVGSVFGLLTLSKWEAAQRDCGQACPADSVSRQEVAGASRDGSISTFAFLGGGIGLTVGALLWFTAGTSSTSQVSIGVSTGTVSPRELLLRGTF